MRFDWLGSFNRMDLNRRTLAELMKENGYLVEGLCEDYYYNGFWKGFPSRPFLKNIHADRRDSLLLDKALHFMDAHKETPSFVWIHLRGAHPPISDENSFFFIEQEGLSEMSARLRRLTGETDLWTAITRILVPDWNGEGPRIPDEAKEEAELLANELYDGRLRYIDSLVGDLLDELERRAILDRTLLAITSDHGITFQKDFFMSRASREVGARVPLILRWPGRIPANRKVSERVSTIDLFPTILEALDIHPPAGLTGHSLLPLCGGAGDYPSTPLLFVGLNQSMVYFENYRYSCRPIYLSVLLAPDADLEGPPLEGERLSLLGIGDGGEEKDLKEECHDQLVKGRRYLVEFWNAMDACSDGGPVNSALVQFFQKAGYMR
jgi:hypothetical protein